METLKFKTNLKCGGCVSAVQPILDENTNVKKWEVDLENKDRVLTIESDALDVAALIKEIEDKGYKIEQI